MNFGLKLKNLRLDRGFTQEELGEKVGMKKAAISKYENADREPKIEIIEKLSVALGVEIGYFFNAKDKENFVIELLQLLIKQGKIQDAENISEETKNMIINAIKMEVQKMLKAEN